MKFKLLPVVIWIFLTACGGSSDGEPHGGNAGGTGGNGGNTNFASSEEFFAARVQPRMDFCRTCHIPGGVGDVEEGKRFLLSSNSGDDYANTFSAWQAMGEGVEQNFLISKNAEPAEKHAGGKNWPVGSEAYNDMVTLLSCWDDPVNCVLNTAGGTIDQWPLLGSARGGHYWNDFCEGKPDSTVVPQDPRELVVPGVNEGKAVYMNAWAQVCQEDNHPGTCGQLRAWVAEGYPVVASDGEIGAGHFFSGTSSEAGFAFPASDYAGMWESIWGMSSRPEGYDQLVAERWGMPLSQTPNPYPLPGEDPNATDGGSGQLPMGLTQLRGEDGSWSGNINVTCSICHGGQVGEASDGLRLGAMYGNNSVSDITLMFSELARLAPQQGSLALISQNKVRGTGNITNFQLFGLVEGFGEPQESVFPYISIQTEPSTGTEDPPVWWNGGHRSAKFYDGGQVWDAKRIELSFHFPNVPNHGAPGPSTIEADRQWILDHQQQADAWISSLKSPPWPEDRLGVIDVPLAEQGAILFHSKDLWAESLNNPSPEPDGGNGSCASCHGAYSPRYVNDPAYLDSPLLEGMASYVVPLEVINTDPRRLQGNSPAVVAASRSAWFAYKDGPFNEAGAPVCGNWNDPEINGGRKLGYLAPPLYGVWATAPYFHNGSVPNIEQVLNPEGRPTIWSRISKPAPEGLEGQVIMGYDTTLDTGYDKTNLGWNYTEMACGTGSSPFLDCNPVDDEGATIQDALAEIWVRGGLSWNLLNVPIFSDQQIEERKIYNTRYYSQSNTGHEFSSVLTQAERLAIMEYLKTL